MEKFEAPKVVAFEGINRSGKGTQIEELRNALDLYGLNSIVLRGDGTREGRGEHEGDPYNQEWIDKVARMRATGTNEDWHRAAYQLADELRAWKEKLAECQDTLLLVDRSLISRGSFVLKNNGASNVGILEINDLYPVQSGEPLSLESVLPDVIFLLWVPKEVALARLEQGDQKLVFRQKIIEESYDIFYTTTQKLPQVVRDRVVTIDSSRPVDEVFDQIVFKLNNLYGLQVK